MALSLSRSSLALVGLWLFLAAALPAAAQTGGAAAAQDPLASAQASVEAGVASPEALEALRLDVITVREAASAVLARGSVEARAAQAQLEALGPAPSEGETEAADIAARRAELTEALAQASAPLRRAEEDVRRAEVLLDEIARLTARSARQALLSRLPSPAAPATWIEAAADLQRWRAAVARHSDGLAVRPGAGERMRAAIAPALALAAGGFALILLGTPLVSRRLRGILDDGARWPGAAFVARLAQLAPPALGATALVSIPPLFGAPPPQLSRVVEVLPVIAALPIAGWWLGLALFAPDAPASRMIGLPEQNTGRATRLSFGLGCMLALELAAEALARDHVFAGATVSALAGPIILWGAWLLWRLGSLLRAAPHPNAEAAHGADFLRLLTRLMQGGAIGLALAVGLGYVTLAREVADSLVLTVALAALALAVHRGVMAAIAQAVATPSGEHEPLALLSVGLAAVIAILWAPLLLAVWGASATDLAELWRRLSQGVSFGEIRLSLDGIATLAIVFTLGLFLTRWVQKILRFTILPRTRLDAGAQNALLTGTGYIGTSLAAVGSLSAAGLDLSNLAVIAGALSVGIGFGLQSVVSNFVSGLILLVERPIREGDLIEVAGAKGYVRKIAVRATRIQTFDQHDVIVPNAELITGVVRNLTLTGRSGRLIVPVGVAYGSDPDTVIGILAAAARHHPGVMTDPAPFAVFVALGESALDFELYCHLRDIGETLTVRSDLLRAICRDLETAGVEIPFPQHDIRLREINSIVEALGVRANRQPSP
jgi:small-conductance mechanosensitive channel